MTIESTAFDEQASGSSSWVQTAPSGLVENDVVVLIIRLNTTSDLLSSVSKRSQDSAWVTQISDSAYERVYVLTSTIGAGGTPPSTFTVTLSSNASGNTIAIALRGRDESLFDKSTVATGTSTSPAAGIFSVPPPGSNDYITYTAFDGASNSVSAYPTGYPDFQGEAGPSTRQAGIACDQGISSPPGAKTWTIANSADWMAVTVVLPESANNLGFADATEGADSAAGTGKSYSLVSGTASILEDNDDAAGVGVTYTDVTGSAAITEDTDAASGTGRAYTQVTGTAGVTEGADSAAGSGRAYETITGTSAVTEDNDDAAGTGIVSSGAADVSGAAMVTDGADAAVATGKSYTVVSGTLALTEASDASSQPALATASKHVKCCCAAGCEICDDDFGRPDENPVSGDWTEVEGDFGVVDFELRVVTAGLLLTSCQPPPKQDSNYFTHIFRTDLTGSGAGPWKIICKYIDDENFDWVLIEEVTVGSPPSTGLQPKFYRRIADVDALMFDPENDYPQAGVFPRPENNGGVMPVTVCYGKEQWAFYFGVGSQGFEAECGDPDPEEDAVSPGFIGYMDGPSDGTFDRFAYEVLWETDHTCVNCVCLCANPGNDFDYKCLKSTLYLTLMPQSGFLDSNCPGGSGTVLEWVLLQSLPINPPLDPTTTPVTFDAYPEKRYWFSEPFFQCGAADPCTDPSEADECLLVWWRLECIERGEYELSLLVYPTGAQTPPIAAAVPIAQFNPLDGITGSLATNIDCGVTSGTGIVRIDFNTFHKNTLEIGSGSGIFNCCPFPDLRYDVWIDDAP